MEYVAEIGVFLGKAVVIVAAIAVIISLIASAVLRGKESLGQLEIEDLNQTIKNYAHSLKSAILSKKLLKNLKKERKQEKKTKKATGKQDESKVYVLDFHGDIRASATENLATEITAVLSVVTPDDEVVVRLESPGGMVHSYGLAASQLKRVREQGIKLTICVDKVAASGGYMMACIADRILAAPFAILGSVGVLAQVPNFHRLLKKHDVDYEEITAGEYKRTLSLFGEITEPGKKKFLEQIEDTHDLFKSFVKEHRPQVDLAQVATGEHWYGLRAKNLNLLDEIQTSDAYLANRTKEAQVYIIKMVHKKKLSEKISETVSLAAEKATEKVLRNWEGPRA